MEDNLSRSLRCVVMSTLLATLVSMALAAPAIAQNNPIPRSLSNAPDLSLGTATKDFIGSYSAHERQTDRRGIRQFDVRSNTLPHRTTAMRCEFKDNRLYYIEMMLDPTVSWQDLIADNTQVYGLPGDWSTVAGGNVAVQDDLDKSAVWKDSQTLMMIGHTSGGPCVIGLASADSLADVLKSIEDEAYGRSLYQMQMESWARLDAERAAAEAQSKYRYPGPYEVRITISIDKDYFMLHRGGDEDGSGPDVFLSVWINDREVTRSSTTTDSYSMTWNASFSWKPGQTVALYATDEDGFLTNTSLAALEWPGGDTFPLTGEVALSSVLGSEAGSSRVTFEVRSAPGQ